MTFTVNPHPRTPPPTDAPKGQGGHLVGLLDALRAAGCDVWGVVEQGSSIALRMGDDSMINIPRRVR